MKYIFNSDSVDVQSDRGARDSGGALEGQNNRGSEKNDGRGQ